MSSDLTRVWVHTGIVSVDNGATYPAEVFFELSDCLDQDGEHTIIGDTYGLDSLMVSSTNLDTVVELLTEAKVVFAIHPRYPWGSWTNMSPSVIAKYPTLNNGI